MFRIAIDHTDAEHPDRETFTWQGTFPSQETAEAALPAAMAEFPVAAGYDHHIEKLELLDDQTSEWKAV